MRKPTLIEAYRALWRTGDWRNRVALISNDTMLTYGELAERVESLADSLLAHGIEPGETVALSMARTGDSVVVLLAVLFAGGCVCPMESRLSAEEVARRLGRLRCRWAITDEAMASQFASVPEDCSVIERVRLQDNRSSMAFEVAVTPEMPALTLFTSGSTGDPKALQLTHRALEGNAYGVAQHTGLSTADRLLHIMPIYHTNGLNNQLFAPLLSGSSIAFAPRFRAENMPELMDRYRPTIVTGVPTMYSRMLAYEFSADAKQNLRMIRCGSAPISVDLHERIESAFGCPVVVSYGLSEATCTSTMNPPGSRRIGTVGKVLPGQTVELLHPDRDVPVGAGQEGEISIAGPSLMSGYLDAQGRPDPSDIASGWFRSGDLGRFDGDGYLTITGRLKDVIIRGGENIAPELIEHVIASDPTVESCCVVGRPDEDLGEVPVAFVVACGGEVVDQEHLIELVAERLSRPYKPSSIYLVNALPENGIGKVDRKALARRVREGDAAVG